MKWLFYSFRSIFGQYHIWPVAIMLSACTAQNQYVQNDSAETDSTTVPVEKLHLSTDTEAQYKWQKNNCPRGIPAPTLNFQNPNITGKNFVLSENGGKEAAKLFNGDSLFIDNTGCEFYVLTYTLKSYSTAQTVPQHASYWFGRSADLLLALQDSDVPFDYRSTAEKLKNLSLLKDTKTGVEYTLAAENNIIQKAVLEEFGKLPGKGSFMKLKLFIGPL